MILAAVGMSREARIVSRPGVRPVMGAGRSALLETRLREAMGEADAVLSIGLGGALDPGLQVGDVVIGRAVLRPRGRWECDGPWTEALRRRLPGARLGAVFGSDEMVLQSLEKARIRRETEADLVDMESHVAARLAAERGLPLAVLRVVSDTAGVSLPPAVKAGIRPDGGMDLAGVLAALCRDPRQLPALMRTGREAGRAFQALQSVVDEAFASVEADLSLRHQD